MIRFVNAISLVSDPTEGVKRKRSALCYYTGTDINVDSYRYDDSYRDRTGDRIPGEIQLWHMKMGGMTKRLFVFFTLHEDHLFPAKFTVIICPMKYSRGHQLPAIHLGPSVPCNIHYSCLILALLTWSITLCSTMFPLTIILSAKFLGTA